MSEGLCECVFHCLSVIRRYKSTSRQLTKLNITKSYTVLRLNEFFTGQPYNFVVVYFGANNKRRNFGQEPINQLRKSIFYLSSVTLLICFYCKPYWPVFLLQFWHGHKTSVISFVASGQYWILKSKMSDQISIINNWLKMWFIYRGKYINLFYEIPLLQ